MYTINSTQSAVTFFRPVSKENFGTDMVQAVNRHIDNHTTNGVDWPYDAEFCVVYDLSTWPCGWSKEPYICFFSDRQELDDWIAAKMDWATLEDNYVAFKAYEWDLGPTLLKNDCHNPDLVGSRKAMIVD